MPAVVVELPPDLEDQIFSAMQTMIERALNVAHEVPTMLKEHAMLDGFDVNGQQMQAKKPRPKRDPQNYPNIPCFDTGNMMDNTRWTSEIVSPSEAEVVYSPPDYFDYLIEKDPAHGGRPWITRDRIPDDVRAMIEEKMILALSDDGTPSQAGYPALQEGFELA